MEKESTSVSLPPSRLLPVLFSFLALITGGLIYIFFRPSEPVFFTWIHYIGFESWLEAIRAKSTIAGGVLPRWMIYSLPNGLWAFAFTALMLCIWTESRSWLKYVWFLGIPFMVFGFEVLQLTGTLQGTFCWNDILSGAVGMTGAVIMVFLAPGSTGRKAQRSNNLRAPHPVLPNDLKNSTILN